MQLSIAICCRHWHTHTQPFNGLWSRTTRVGRYQKKHSPTHTHPDHRTSFIIFLHLQCIPFVHFTCLTVLSYNLSPRLFWSSSWSWTLNFILHTFLHPIIIFFSQHMPIPTQPVLLQYKCYVIYTDNGSQQQIRRPPLRLQIDGTDRQTVGCPTVTETPLSILCGQRKQA